MGLHMALGVQTWSCKVKRDELRLKLGQSTKVFRRLKSTFRADLIYLGKMKVETDLIAGLKHCGWWMKIAEPQVLQLMVSRQVWLGMVFLSRSEPLIRRFGSLCICLRPAALPHEHSSLLLHSHENRREETTKLSPGCNLTTAQTTFPHRGRDGHGCTHTSQCSELYTLFRHPLSSLYLTKTAKTPKEKRISNTLKKQWQFWIEKWITSCQRNVHST